MVGQVLAKRCSVLMMIMFFLVIFMGHVSNANIANCLKNCQEQCMKETKDAPHDVCENACNKLCNELRFTQAQYFNTQPEYKSIACRMINWGCP
ncbi:hypothetical protein BRARA_I03351 [Brassica rapa]|uniref:Plant thionin family protein n=1 Tax=Brassica campestris TaxID=3711 RepID=A0A397Y0J0_BRACM|nr:hypothetical protein BRARA_I03351 [Brassica rapa]